VAVALALVASVPALAQNRQDQQMLAEQRIIHEEMQKLLLVVNTLAEQLKSVATTTNARLDDQAGTVRKNYADQKAQIDGLIASVNTLREKVDDSKISVNRLASESAAIRKNLEIVTNLLTQTLAEIQAPASTPATPAAGGDAPIQTVASPSSYLDSAYGYYTVGQYDLAVEGFQEYLKRFPEAPDTVKAQFYIGESYNNAGKFKEAVAAYELVITTPTARDSEYLPQAYYKQGLGYEKLKQPANARKNYQLILKDFKDSPMAIMAAQQLPKVGGL
jgi:TolA-binding protein